MLVIDTWNGSGYSESRAFEKEFTTQLQAMEWVKREVAHTTQLEPEMWHMSEVSNSERFTLYYDDGEDAGALSVVFKKPSNLLAVAVYPMVNHYELITEQDELDGLVDFIKESSDDYKEDGVIFDTIHHNIHHKYGDLIISTL